jgi:DNA-binding LacI/PurR family transcriptional regulator/AraC-like DNA-binding protein
MRKRIGVVLASIHTGSSKGFWSDLATQAKEHEDALFVFPGGRLSCQDQYEYLRGSIYSLVNAKNLDALVSWGSSLGGSVSLEEVEAFHDRFNTLPYVTYSLKRPGHPNIGFDAYGGMQALVIHCILIHGAKRIAFIRGPENHQGAQDRYRAYTDALSQCSLKLDPRLVSSPTSWHDGARAFHELVDERHLVPGKDFDTLVCSSDLMMFASGKILEERGYSIPKDLRLVGFNDTEESLLLKVPCTTVHMPVQKMALMAYSMVSDLAERKLNADADILLPAPLVIRNSCGCTDTLGGEEKAKELFEGDPAAFRHWLRENFTGFDLEGARDDEKIKQEMYRYLEEGGDVFLVDEAITWYDHFFCKDHQEGEKLRKMLLRQKDLVDREDAYEETLRMRRLNLLKNALLCTHSMDDISSIIRQYLPDVGIPGCYLVLQQNDESVLVGGFDNTWTFQKRVSFSSTLLLPEQLEEKLVEGIYVVEPLFMENQSLGYVVLKSLVTNGTLLEELRTSLSSAVKGALLLDATNKAKEMAENAERTKTEFFANISLGLRDPLDEILALTKGTVNEGKVKGQLSKAGHLLELAISQTGSLEMDYSLVSLSSGLPPVRVDKERMEQIFQALKDCIEEDGGACVVANAVMSQGLSIIYASSKETWNASLHRQDPLFALAERLFLLEGGGFELQKNEIRMMLPWPNLGGASPSIHPEREGKPMYLGEKMPIVLDGISSLDPDSLVGDPKVLEGCSVMVVDAAERSFSIQLALHQMEDSEEGRHVPIICVRCPEGYDSLSEAFHAARQGQGNHLMFLFGTVPEGLERLGLPADFVSVKDVQEFEHCEEEHAPSLCIMRTIDAGLVTEIRKRSQVPILIVCEQFSAPDVEKLSVFPRIVIVNGCMGESDEFLSRAQGILEGDEILPSLTGILVKRAIVYLNKNATNQISRWQLAEAVNVSEDYLTRIFRKEEGLSPWDYLNRYRIHIATRLLQQTSMTINEVASQSGFQDQAYFCRVFKKAMGCNPGKIRQRKMEEKSEKYKSVPAFSS